MNGFFDGQNRKFVATIWLLILGLVVAFQVVKVNLDNRSKAEEVVDGNSEIASLCGSADNTFTVSRPIENLCRTGAPIWIDSVVNDGLYRWSCVDDVTGKSSECGAFLSN